MSKQADKFGKIVDTFTADIISPAPEPEPKKRGRGRPVTGTAKTDAERQKARRLRLKDAGLVPVTVVLPIEAVAGLRGFVRFKNVTPGAVVGKLITGQLLRKRSGGRRDPNESKKP